MRHRNGHRVAILTVVFMLGVIGCNPTGSLTSTSRVENENGKAGETATKAESESLSAENDAVETQLEPTGDANASVTQPASDEAGISADENAEDSVASAENQAGGSDQADQADQADQPGQEDQPDQSDSVDTNFNRQYAIDGVTEIVSFDDIVIDIQPDTRFRPIMLRPYPRTRDLLGKRVNIGGFINPTDRLEGIDEFILLRNLECKFGPGGQADHLVRVFLKDGVTTRFTDEVVYVEGVLELNPFHSPGGDATWSLYDLKADRVSTRKPIPRR